jgi:ABC-type dipeptide/oligopeptide/nickel transport system permease component
VIFQNLRKRLYGRFITLRYVIIRIVDSIPTVFLILVLVFIAMRILPGDPAIAAMGDNATQEQLDIFRERMGLNEPLFKQFMDFALGALTLDFGVSLMDSRPVMGLILYNLPYTIELTFGAMLIGFSVGIPMGIIAAVNRNSWPDGIVRIFSMIGYAVPDFYLAALLLITFSLQLGWFPINGAGTDLADRIYHLFLPALTLALVKASFIGRLTRASVLEVLNADFVRTARAKGANSFRIVFHHALRNALLPLTTGFGLSLLATLSGSVAIELVFNRPGIGQLLISAIAERDYAVIQAGVLVFAMFVVIINLLIDLIYIIVDPGIRVK